MILVSDKDDEMRAVIAAQLREVGVECLPVGCAHEIRSRLGQGAVKVWVTDAVFPEVKLDDLIREARQLSAQTQVLILTRGGDSETELADVTRLIEAGANDFLAKPFDRSSLVAKVKTLLRRLGLPQAEQSLSMGDLTLDSRSGDVYCGIDRTPLTPSEFKLLKGLMLKQDTVLSRDQLIEIVQGAGIVVVDRAVDTHVASLRKKLGACGAFIETVRGVGYRIRSL